MAQAPQDILIENRVMGVLDTLSTKLNTPISQLYIVMIKQVKVEAINSCIVTVLYIIGWIVFRSFWNDIDTDIAVLKLTDSPWPTELTVKFYTLFVGGLVGLVFFLPQLVKSILGAVNAWLNPEGVAFNRILRYFN